MNRAAQTAQNQAQTIRRTITIDFTLMQFNLMQDRIDHVLINRFRGNIF